MICVTKLIDLDTGNELKNHTLWGDDSNLEVHITDFETGAVEIFLTKVHYDKILDMRRSVFGIHGEGEGRLLSFIVFGEEEVFYARHLTLLSKDVEQYFPSDIARSEMNTWFSCFGIGALTPDYAHFYLLYANDTMFSVTSILHLISNLETQINLNKDVLTVSFILKQSNMFAKAITYHFKMDSEEVKIRLAKKKLQRG